MDALVSTYLFIKSKKCNKLGLAPIYCRLTQNGNVKEFSLKKRINPSLWDIGKQRVKGTNEHAKTINYHIESVLAKISQEFSALFSKGSASIDNLVGRLNGTPSEHTIQRMLDGFINEHYEKLPHDGSITRINRYRVAQSKLKKFTLHQFQKSDYPISDLTPDFIKNFETHLISTGNQKNTAINYLKILKRIGNTAFYNGWIDKNPFQNFKCSYSYVHRNHLTEEEINKIINVDLPSTKLDRVRDCLLFSCFTGLAFSDAKKLKRENIITGVDGKKWIEVFRTKTNVRSCLPLLEVPLAILKKYEDDPICNNKGVLLPLYSLSKQNDYLKVVGLYAGLTKNITSHIGRHTWAVMALTMGVPIETLSKTLGHTSIRTTAIYAKVVDEKVSKEINQFQDKISGIFTYAK